MFTGIVEEIGTLQLIKKERKNLLLGVSASFLSELSINQSIAHNGICLTITDIKKDLYIVCVVHETISKTNIQTLNVGDLINLERCLVVGDRIDGHIVQGHVDRISECVGIKETNGSWWFSFKYLQSDDKYLVEKGSICVNGVSLTIANIHPNKTTFSVAIIPHTFENTNFKKIKKGDFVNIEFDILAKQIANLMAK